ncbi:MAG: single-stranded DNA-binding protein [Eubacterium sp.]|nr:single-stranded DNA-binding protein [Eubacterium sp.]
MNSITLWGRLTKDPVIRWIEAGSSQERTCVARYTLAVNRQDGRNKDDAAQTADYIPCVTFGKNAEIAERYFKKGTAVVISGRLKSGNYMGKDGRTVFTLDVQVDRQEFTERKAVMEQTSAADKAGYTDEAEEARHAAEIEEADRAAIQNDAYSRNVDNMNEGMNAAYSGEDEQEQNYMEIGPELY